MFVCLFVSWITQKIVNGYRQNCVEGLDMGTIRFWCRDPNSFSILDHYRLLCQYDIGRNLAYTDQHRSAYEQVMNGFR